MSRDCLIVVSLDPDEKFQACSVSWQTNSENLSPCTSNSSPPAFPFSAARPCPNSLSIARPPSATPPSPCSIATASSARRGSRPPSRRHPGAGRRRADHPRPSRRRCRAARACRARWRASPNGPFPPHFWRLPLVVASQEGYRNLCRLIARMKLPRPKGDGGLTLRQFPRLYVRLVAFAGRPALIAPRRGRRPAGSARRHVWPQNVYVELAAAWAARGDGGQRRALALASAFTCRSSPRSGVRFAAADERPLFDVLTCIITRPRWSRRDGGSRRTPSAI